MIHPRASVNRVTTGIAVAILILSFLLTGSGGAAAQGSDPKQQQYGPASPQELEALQQAEQNVGSPDNPIFEGGYPAFGPQAPEVAPANAATAWTNNWATGALCSGNEGCLVGDFNGDGKADVAVLYGDSRADPQRGDVMVATSTGAALNAATRWNDYMCVTGQLCKVGDVNNDGKDDIVIFNPVQNGFNAAGNVLVALSTGSSFSAPTLWQKLFCVGAQICQVGNVDGAGGDDIVLFRRSSDPGSYAGDVEVALSNSFNGFGAAAKWNDFFCINQEDCQVADMNGDGAADAVSFVKTGDGKGRMAVALSTRYSFSGASDWATWQQPFCVDGEQCGLSDFNGDHKADAMKFGTNGSRAGDVVVRISTGGGLAAPSTWHGPFCLPGSDCSYGDFNGDGRADIVRFVKASSDPSQVGAAYVALASGTAVGFVQTPPYPGNWLNYPCQYNQSCLTGDFNGDGLTDLAYLVRDTQGGAGRGNVLVALNQGGNQFSYPALWLNYTCVGQDVCKVGDVNADGKDDLIIFSRTTPGAVYVNKSTGSSFEQSTLWNSYFCVGGEVCDVGDFNGDGLADIILFTRSTYGNNDRAGDVEVALNSGNQFVNTGLWHTFFCIGTENCRVGDFNGDGRDDIVTFTKGSSAKVYVALSTGRSFGTGNPPAEQWQSFFCAGSEWCDVGDANGDGKTDVIAFLESNYPSNPDTIGAVYVGVSRGSAAAGGFVSERWGSSFCVGSQLCGVGYFNRDNRADVLAFDRTSVGAVYVALSAAGTGYYFRDATVIPSNARRNYLPVMSR